VHGPDGSADVPAGATYRRADYGGSLRWSRRRGTSARRRVVNVASALVAIAGAEGDNGTYNDERTPAAPNPIALRRDVRERLHRETTAELAGVR